MTRTTSIDYHIRQHEADAQSKWDRHQSTPWTQVHAIDRLELIIYEAVQAQKNAHARVNQAIKQKRACDDAVTELEARLEAARALQAEADDEDHPPTCASCGAWAA